MDLGAHGHAARRRIAPTPILVPPAITFAIDAVPRQLACAAAP